MVGPMTHRRVKKRKRPGEKSGMKFAVILAIMIIAVGLGYLTARFVIGPLLGYDADESPINIAGKEETETEVSDTSEKPDDGYALQFGVFSSKESADKLKAALAEKGIETTIIQADNAYKVISPVIKTKDEAIEKLNDIRDKDVEDVFIASF